jgi:RNA polymerase sigma-70 factor (ECF subfamily)
MFLFGRNKYRNASDEDLISLYKKEGASQAIGQLYERYGHLVMGTCMKYMKNQMDAEDVVMKIFEELGQKLMRFEIQHFKSWLYQLTRNECLMILRKQKKDLPASLLEQMSEDPSELYQATEKELQLALLEGTLTELKEEQRRCLELFFLKDRSYSEIAEEIGIDIKQVKSAIQNGKRNLKLKLEEHHAFKTKP